MRATVAVSLTVIEGKSVPTSTRRRDRSDVALNLANIADAANVVVPR